ncbi:tripartite tricarboxylate transporter substrate-binding protein [Ramlibacter tataouinensis]|uniref:Bug family tripartite tricarboxylate transporter substrate binding protein n=1 Tax=Ramlibacter tataouinensis TaxID=94132 RepID=UPI0022F388AB|nr:tripartite tricarboxylate transporter substrate-binding protein [Ramlibacter tataouinensis]WBY03567.1 tripartite tricarboxylate transporter substrate-binding protein [Ramlibacter tataouinensis]
MKVFTKQLVGVALALVSGIAAAQFPTKPIRIVVPYAPGSTLEPIVRAIGDDMSQTLKQPVVIEYKPGASTTIGAAYTAAAPADGHTLFVNAASFLISAQLMSKLPYNPQTAFVPITGLAESAHVLISPIGSPHKTAKEFIAHSKANGANMSYGSFGNASSGHLGFERMKKLYGFTATHIPYKGNEGLQDIIAGRLDSMLNDLPVVIPFAKDSKIRALAIATDKRDPNLPDVPTFEEATGVPFQSKSWFGILVRAETPAAIRSTLNTAITSALRKPEIAKKLTDLGVKPTPSTSEAFAEFMAQESKRFADAIAFANVRME